MPYVATLTNVAPTFDDCDNPTGITITSTTIKTFAGKNGSVDDSNYTKELTSALDHSQINFSGSTGPRTPALQSTITDRLSGRRLHHYAMRDSFLARDIIPLGEKVTLIFLVHK